MLRRAKLIPLHASHIVESLNKYLSVVVLQAVLFLVVLQAVLFFVLEIICVSY